MNRLASPQPYIPLQGLVGSSMANHYQLLEIERTATGSEIKKAFRNASRKYHPDKFPEDKDEAQKKFDEINTVRTAEPCESAVWSG